MFAIFHFPLFILICTSKGIMRIPNFPSLSTLPLRVGNLITLINTLCFILLILFISGIIEFPSFSFFSHSSTQPIKDNSKSSKPFTDVGGAFKKWDSKVGCGQFKNEINQRNNGSIGFSNSLQDQFGGKLECGVLKMKHVSVLVKEWTWIPDNLENMYFCQCGLSCLWTKSPVLADNPDAILFESITPPPQRSSGQPLRVYMNLEAEKNRSGREEIFIGYHATDDLQSTYATALLHNERNYHLSAHKDNVPLVYWSSSSQCTTQRNKLAHKLLSLLPHHSLGKCLNNVGGTNKVLRLYPECVYSAAKLTKWWDHIHCVMSHYKFVLVIESIWTESYVTEKLFSTLDSGAIPIYFGAPNIMDFVPPNSIIEGMKFKTMEELASYVKEIASDPIAYGGFHAWRRCGVLGNYTKTKALSLDTLPCRLCQAISIKGGRNEDV